MKPFYRMDYSILVPSSGIPTLDQRQGLGLSLAVISDCLQCHVTSENYFQRQFRRTRQGCVYFYSTGVGSHIVHADLTLTKWTSILPGRLEACLWDDSFWIRPQGLSCSTFCFFAGQSNPFVKSQSSQESSSIPHSKLRNVLLLLLEILIWNYHDRPQ